MAIYKTSDSYSAYDPYADKFSLATSKRPMPASSEAATESVKDTLGISKEKLKEEALGRLGLQEKSSIPPNQLVKIGKYLFVAVAFPPYLALIAIPKWLLLEGIPLVIDWNKQLFLTVCKQLKTPFEVIFDKIKGMIVFTKNLFQTLVSPVQKLMKMVIAAQNRFAAFVASRLIELEKFFSVPYQKIANKMEPLKKVRVKMSQAFEKAKQFTLTLAARLRDFPLEAFEKSKQFANQVLEKGLSLKDSAFAPFLQAAQSAERGANFCLDKVEEFFGKIKRQLSPLLQAIQVLKKPFSVVFQAADHALTSLEHFFARQAKKLHSLQERVYSSVGNFHPALLAMRLAGSSFFTRLPSSVQEKVRDFLLSHFFQQLILFALKAVKLTVSFFLTPCELIFLGLSQVFAKVKEGIKQFKAVLKGFFEKISSCLSSLFDALIRKFFKKVLYLFFLFFVIIAIVLLHGWKLLGTLSSDLRLSIKKLCSR